jgi:Leu/Phe-tRNA-protein transferase
MADDDGLVGVGADLEPGTILAAYRRGLFPMPLGGRGPLGWWSPDPRAVIPLDGLRVSRSLRRSLPRYEIRVDTAFDQVIDACSDPSRPHGWISSEIRAAYRRLHELGWVHSVEAWASVSRSTDAPEAGGGGEVREGGEGGEGLGTGEVRLVSEAGGGGEVREAGEVRKAGGGLGDGGGGEAWEAGGGVDVRAGAAVLAGGLYGVAIGGLFAGESMFHRQSDASKAALVGLVDLLRAGGVERRVLDVQWMTPHLASLGAVDVSRADYVGMLADAVGLPLPPAFADRGR